MQRVTKDSPTEPAHQPAAGARERPLYAAPASPAAALAREIGRSPRVLAQRRAIDRAFGPAAARSAGRAGPAHPARAAAAAPGLRPAVIAAPVLQGVFLPYEPPLPGAEAATLESYLRLIAFRRSAVVHTMGRDGQAWFAEKWKALAESRKTKPVANSLGLVQEFIGEVLAARDRREALRQEILPWDGNENEAERLSFYRTHLARWGTRLVAATWTAVQAKWEELEAEGETQRLEALAVAVAKRAGGDIAAAFSDFKSYRHYYRQMVDRQDLLQEALRDWPQQWQQIQLQLLAFIKANREDRAHAYLHGIVTATVNPALKRLSEPQDAIRPMPQAEQEGLLDLFKQEIGVAIETVQALRANDAVLSSVFQARGAEIADVKTDLAAVEAQLWEWRWQKKSKVVLDKAGTAAAGGTSATAEPRTGKLDLTRGWAEKPTRLERQQTLIHEASHASAVKTKDLAYMWGWAYAALSGPEKRRNADSYAEAAGRHRNADAKLKDLKFAGAANSPGNNPALLDLAKRGLGEMDRTLAQARTLSGNMSKMLHTKPEITLDHAWWEFGRMLQAPFATAAWTETKPRSGYGITNADVEVLMMFRDSLKAVHQRIGNVAQLELVPAADTIAIDATKIQLGLPLLESAPSAQAVGLAIIRELYSDSYGSMPWGGDVIPAIEKLNGITPNWRSIEPTVPAEDEHDDRPPAQKNDPAIRALEAAAEQTQAWWKGYYPGGTGPRPALYAEALALSKSLSSYLKEGIAQLQAQTRADLIRSNAIQRLEGRFNEIGIALASAKQAAVPDRDQAQWKLLKQLGTIAHQAREAWIGRPAT